MRQLHRQRPTSQIDEADQIRERRGYDARYLKQIGGQPRYARIVGDVEWLPSGSGYGVRRCERLTVMALREGRRFRLPGGGRRIEGFSTSASRYASWKKKRHPPKMRSSARVGCLSMLPSSRPEDLDGMAIRPS